VAKGPLSEKVLDLQAKISALEDCMLALKQKEDLPLSTTIQMVRKLANKEFRAIVKKSKVQQYMRLNP